MTARVRSFGVHAAVLAAAALALAGCGKDAANVPGGPLEADKFLFERGTEALEKKRWLTAREYFTRLVDNYPQSPFRPDAKLGVGDAFLGEGSTEAYVLAIAEFREFLTFYPTNPRADYAQYKLGMAHYKQMRGPERDQTETRAAIAEFEAFVERYPNSPLLPEARTKLREARDRLGMSELRVGVFYYRTKWYPGAIDRLKNLVKNDPQFTHRDSAYYHLAESLVKMNRAAEALPYYDRLVKEFENSEYLDEAKKRLAEYASITPPAPQPAPAAPTPAPATDGQQPPAGSSGTPARPPSR